MMKNDVLVVAKVCLLVLILVLLIYLVYVFNGHMVEIKEMLHSIKDYIKENPVDTYPLIP